MSTPCSSVAYYRSHHRYSYWLQIAFVLFIFFNMSPMLLMAQQAQTIFRYPTSNAISVPINPVIEIATSLPIDSSSFTFEYPVLRADSTYEHELPSILLLEYHDYQMYPASVWRSLAMRGVWALTSTTTATLTPEKLHFSTTYIVITKGIRLITNTIPPDTINAPDTSIVFTTAAPPPAIQAVSLERDASAFFCNDTLSVDFSQPLLSATTMAGDILEIHKVTGYNYTNTTTVQYTSALVSGTYWLSSDKKIIYGTATAPLSPDESYFLKVNISRVTGDPTQDVSVPFSVQSHVPLYLGSKVANTSAPLPQECAFGIGDSVHTYTYGDTARYTIPQRCGEFQFSHWSCPELPLVNGTTNPSVTLLIPSCTTQPTGIHLTAVYTRVLGAPVIVQNTNGALGQVRVYRYGIFKGGIGTYFLPKASDESIEVYAEAKAGYYFDHWKSSDPGLNNTSEPYLFIAGNRLLQFTLDPVFKPGISPSPIPCGPPFSLTLDVRKPGYTVHIPDDNLVNLADIVEVEFNTVPMGVPSHTEIYPTARPVTVTARIKAGYEECWAIRSSYVSDDRMIEYGSIYDPKVTSITRIVNLQSPYCDRSIIISIVRQFKRVEVETVLNQSNAVFNKHTLLSLVPKPLSVLSQGYELERGGFNYMERQVSDNRLYYKVVYWCGQHVVVDYVLDKDISTKTTHFERWSCTPAQHYCGGTPLNQPLPIAVTTDYTLAKGKRLQGRLLRDFALDEIGVAITPANKESVTYISVKDFYGAVRQGATDPSSAPRLQIASSTGTTALYFKFSKPVQRSSVEGTARIAVQDMLPAIGSKRIDCVEAKTYVPGVGYNNYTWLDGDKVFKLELKTPAGSGAYYKATKMQELAIAVKTGIKSVDNDNLKNPSEYRAETEYPRLRWTLEQTTLNIKPALVPLAPYSGADLFTLCLAYWGKSTNNQNTVEQSRSSHDPTTQTGYGHYWNVQRGHTVGVGGHVIIDIPQTDPDKVLNVGLATIRDGWGDVEDNEFTIIPGKVEAEITANYQGKRLDAPLGAAMQRAISPYLWNILWSDETYSAIPYPSYEPNQLNLHKTTYSERWGASPCNKYSAIGKYYEHLVTRADGVHYKIRVVLE